MTVMYVDTFGVGAKTRRVTAPRTASTDVTGSLDRTVQCSGASTVSVNTAFRSGWSKQGKSWLASAGTSTLTRVYSGPSKKRKIGRVSCQGLPLGSSIEGTWKTTESPLGPGDGFLVWTEWTAVKETTGLRFSPLLERGTITAEALIDDALGAGVDTPCLLAVVAR